MSKGFFFPGPGTPGSIARAATNMGAANVIHCNQHHTTRKRARIAQGMKFRETDEQINKPEANLRRRKAA